MRRDSIIDLTFLPEAREVYEAPVIETVEVRVERGFQATGDGSDELGERPDDGGSW